MCSLLISHQTIPFYGCCQDVCQPQCAARGRRTLTSCCKTDRTRSGALREIAESHATRPYHRLSGRLTSREGKGGRGGKPGWLLCGAPTISSSAHPPGALLLWLCCVLHHRLDTFQAALAHQGLVAIMTTKICLTRTRIAYISETKQHEVNMSHCSRTMRMQMHSLQVRSSFHEGTSIWQLCELVCGGMQVCRWAAPPSGAPSQVSVVEPKGREGVGRHLRYASKQCLTYIPS